MKNITIRTAKIDDLQAIVKLIADDNVVDAREEYTGMGIGTKLMNRAIERAKERNCCLAQLTTNKKRLDARRFYERLGFKSTHEGMKLEII